MRNELNNLEARVLFALPTPDHVVIVVEENRSDNQVYGSSKFPNFNSWLASGAKFTNWKDERPGQPSYPHYLDLMYGSNLGITDDNATSHSISRYNQMSLGRELIDANRTFVSYSEDLPAVGSEVSTSGKYAAKHNVTMRGINAGVAAQFRLPVSSNRPFSGAGNWSSDFNTLPLVSFVSPNLNNDGHDKSDNTADNWLAAHIDSYRQWAQTHNSILAIVWDEDEGSGKMAAGIWGQGVKPGIYSETTNHFGLLRTIEDMYGLGRVGASASASPITDIFGPVEPPPPPPPPDDSVFLSDLTPTSAVNGWGNFEKDRSNGEKGSSDGHGLKIGGKSYDKGLGVHANSELHFDLTGGNYSSFTSDIGIDDEVGNNGSVVFQVSVDGNVVFSSATLKGSDSHQSIPTIDLAGAHELVLKVLSGADNRYDHADFGNAILSKI